MVDQEAQMTEDVTGTVPAPQPDAVAIHLLRTKTTTTAVALLEAIVLVAMTTDVGRRRASSMTPVSAIGVLLQAADVAHLTSMEPLLAATPRIRTMRVAHPHVATLKIPT